MLYTLAPRGYLEVIGRDPDEVLAQEPRKNAAAGRVLQFIHYISKDNRHYIKSS